MITLGIETSCDETAAAIVENGIVLSSEVSSSVHLHSKYGGVVPEIASRFHVEYISPVLDKALLDAGCSISDIDLVAVTDRPGLPGSVLIGKVFAESIGFAAEVPVVKINHLQGHVISCFLGKSAMSKLDTLFPFLGVVVSGGHTSIYACNAINDFSIIGRTRDDAAGEAFDKVAKIMDMGYPGGPAIERKATEFDPGSGLIKFPKALLRDKTDLDFSFSGIKTAVMYYWKGSKPTEEERRRVSYSFQHAVVETVTTKIQRAAEKTGFNVLAVGGGVVNNNIFRRSLEAMARGMSLELYLPEKDYCSDNAAMMAALGECLHLCSRVEG
ncbi:MAG: tRNA (adenosine(37)-N6)-threonylcarbamoyltransferase complex transferase subunit TsaD [Candidatus Omnitrophica bacterium]|nr:tRNA (adenosine(37)-N6)-threonylcarbamoyltransferase complex transferase subunit TsaD [Candidatus Omnitrophota bacterium]